MKSWNPCSKLNSKPRRITPSHTGRMERKENQSEKGQLRTPLTSVDTDLKSLIDKEVQLVSDREHMLELELNSGEIP